LNLPAELRKLAEGAVLVRSGEIGRFTPPEVGGRPAAVLMLFATGPDGPDVLLIERAATLRSHAGQPAFPGGALDPEDTGPTGAALREATEEVGLDPDSVVIIAELPNLFIPVTGFVVTPVLAWWREPHEVHPVDAQEVAAVLRVPVAELADPRNRQQVRHPSGWVGPAFAVGGLLVWGFTAGLIDKLLHIGGWEQPWTPGKINELPELRPAAESWYPEDGGDRDGASLRVVRGSPTDGHGNV
jgi:8-oxo-dGTP pyrophosphatase MutT (NUDIX family)